MSAASENREETLPVPAFRLHGVGLRYPGIVALEGIDLDIPTASTTVLIGSSGSGKSSVLRVLLGLEWPRQGRVEHHGSEVRRENVLQIRQRIGYVIQSGGLFPHLDVRGNLALLPRHLGWARERIESRIEQLRELTRLPPSTLARFPSELSGGQRQRVALMRALMTDPDALLLDEPMGALDPIVRRELQEGLREVFDRLGKTVLLVTHDLAEAAYFGSRLVLMSEGRIIQQGRLDDLRERPADGFVARFVEAQRQLPERHG